MKFIAVLAALATTAFALPNHPGCTPATYSCAKNPTTHCDGWQVCDVTGSWVYAGDCPPETVCKFNTENGSPYCLPASW